MLKLRIWYNLPRTSLAPIIPVDILKHSYHCGGIMDMELYVLTFKSTSCIVFLFLLSMQVILLLFIYKCINEFSIKVSVLELYVL